MKARSILFRQIKNPQIQDQQLQELKENIEEKLVQFYTHVRTSVGGEYGAMADKIITLCTHHDMVSITVVIHGVSFMSCSCT